MHQKILLTLALLSSAILTFGQSTYSEVYSIIQTNCTGTCHAGANPLAGLDLSLPSSQLYTQLIGGTPSDANAVSLGYKTVTPGYSSRSHLIYMINQGLDEFYTPDASLAMSSHSTLPTLSEVDREMFIQWIQYGASETDTVIDKQVLIDYYDNGLAAAGISRPPSPEEEGLSGFQTRIGPFFLNPLQEVEYFKEWDFELDTDIEVIRMKADMNWQSHHFAVFDLKPSAAPNNPDGLDLVTDIAGQLNVHLNAVEIGAWNQSLDVPLPNNTAYLWDKDFVGVLDYHILNYSPDSILRAEVYLNFYTQPSGSGAEEMHMDFPNYGGFNPYTLQIPPTGPTGTYTETMDWYDPTSTDMINIWRIQGHTHQYGVDFDIYKRNADGTKGDQIYDGYYNQDYTQYQGYYDYAHAPIRQWENPLLQIPHADGLIFEATWTNPTQDTIGFGLTTQDEMFAAYISYTIQQTTAVEPGITFDGINIAAYPNPFEDQIILEMELDMNQEVRVELSDLSGRIQPIFNAELAAGTHREQIDLSAYSIAPGMYFLTVYTEENKIVQKLLHR